MDWSALFKIIPQLGAAALVALILGGLVFYLFWKYIPSLSADFRASLAEAHAVNERQASEFRLAIANLQTSFLETLDKERHAYADSMAAAIASNVALERSIGRLTDALLQGRK